MPVPYSPLAIANEFIISYGQQAGIEHMKLQKLVYCSYGWWMAAEGIDHPRLTDEGPEIWRHGPVFASLYHVLKVFGREPIRAPQSAMPFMQPPRVDEDDANVRELITWIWGRYGHLSGFALSDMTHAEGTPWQRVAAEHNYSVPHNMVIPDQYILEEYTRLINDIEGTALSSGGNGNVGRRRAAEA